MIDKKSVLNAMNSGNFNTNFIKELIKQHRQKNDPYQDVETPLLDATRMVTKVLGKAFETRARLAQKN